MQKHESGGLLGVEIKNANTTIFVMSAYLPTSLDAYGMPESFDSTKESDATQNKRKPTRYIPPLPNGLVIIRTGSLVGTSTEKNYLKRPALPWNRN